MHIGILLFTILAVHALAAGFFTYLQRIKTRPYLQMWTVGWYLLVLHDLAIGPIYWLGASSEGPSSWLLLLGRSLFVASGVAFFCAARIYVNSRPWTPAAFNPNLHQPASPRTITIGTLSCPVRTINYSASIS